MPLRCGHDLKRHEGVKAHLIVAPIIAAAVPAANYNGLAGCVGKSLLVEGIEKIARGISLQMAYLNAVNCDGDGLSVIPITRLGSQKRGAIAVRTCRCSFTTEIFKHLLVLGCSDDVHFKGAAAHNDPASSRGRSPPTPKAHSPPPGGTISI